MDNKIIFSTLLASTRSRLATTLMAAALMATLTVAHAWEPAPEATGQQILHSAQEDAQANRLPEAAEKFLWFHEHVLERDRAMRGVRLSFALMDWAALARRYPPAMAQLLAVRDKAAARIDAGGPSGEMALGEVIRINATLQAHESTREAFARFAQRDPALAEHKLVEALPSLIALNDFELANRHLKVAPILARMEDLYRTLREAPLKMSDEQKAEMLSSQQRYIDVQLARVVLVLSRERRDAEAEQVLARARAMLGPEANLHHMTQALRGIAPPDDDAG